MIFGGGPFRNQSLIRRSSFHGASRGSYALPLTRPSHHCAVSTAATMRQTWPQRRTVLLLLVLQALGVFAVSLQTRYTLAYAPIGASTTKPTPFAVLVVEPAAATTPVAVDEAKASHQGTSKAKSKPAHAAGARPIPQDLRPVFGFESYTSPENEAAARAQIGLLAASGKEFNGSTTLASIAALQDPLGSTIYVQLGEHGGAQSVSLRSFAKDASSTLGGKDKNDAPAPTIELVYAATEPKPVLNKPVVLNSDGKLDEPAQEKTLLQR